MTTDEIVNAIKTTGKSHLEYTKSDPMYKEIDRSYRRSELRSALEDEGYTIHSNWDVLTSKFEWIINKKINMK